MKKYLTLNIIIRFLDIFFSIVFLIFTLPLTLLIILVLIFTGENKILYRQTRVGFNKEIFQIYKFVTMLSASPNIGTGDITMPNDPRVLPFGKFLRFSKLNELPQLINVLKGEMSFVGPRPLTPKMFGFYNHNQMMTIGSVKPGITGIGSIFFRDEEKIFSQKFNNADEFYKEYIAPFKFQLEDWYIKNKSLYLYFKVIFLTFLVLFNPKVNLNYFFNGLPKPLIEIDEKK